LLFFDGDGEDGRSNIYDLGSIVDYLPPCTSSQMKEL